MNILYSNLERMETLKQAGKFDEQASNGRMHQRRQAGDQQHDENRELDILLHDIDSIDNGTKSRDCLVTEVWGNEELMSRYVIACFLGMV